MGFRTHYSKIWYLCILNILSGKNWRNGRCRKNSLTSSFFLEAGHKTPHEKGILSLGKEHPSLERQRDTKRNPNEQALLHFPQFIMFSSYPFLLSHFFLWPSTLYQTWYKNAHAYPHLWVVISLWRLLCHFKFACFSLVNPSFVM